MNRGAGLAPWLPWAAVLVGLYALHSAWWALGLYHVGMLACLMAPGGRPALSGLVRGRVGAVGLALIAASALAGPALFALWPLVAAGLRPLSDGLPALGLGRAAWPWFIAYYALVHPGIEEAYWRGWIVPRARRPWLTDVQFAGYHALVLARFVAWPGVVAAVAVLAASAWAWRRSARESAGLAVPWLSHMVGDASFVVGVCVLLARGA